MAGHFRSRNQGTSDASGRLEIADVERGSLRVTVDGEPVRALAGKPRAVAPKRAPSPEVEASVAEPAESPEESPPEATAPKPTPPKPTPPKPTPPKPTPPKPTPPKPTPPKPTPSKPADAVLPPPPPPPPGVRLFPE